MGMWLKLEIIKTFVTHGIILKNIEDLAFACIFPPYMAFQLFRKKISLSLYIYVCLYMDTQ